MAGKGWPKGKPRKKIEEKIEEVKKEKIEEKVINQDRMIKNGPFYFTMSPFFRG